MPPRLPFTRRRRLWALAFALFAAFLLVRFARLTADPPEAMPNGGDYGTTGELIVEPPAKADEARNRALFGAFQTSPVDNYQFWRVQSPVWVYPLSWFFRAAGVSYATLRTYAIVGAALGYLAFLALAAARLRRGGFALAAAFFGFNYYYVIYSRYGIIEPLTITFVVTTILFVHWSRRDILWLAAAELSLLAAVLTKQTGAYIGPLCLVAGGFSVWRARRTAPRWKLVVPFVVAALMLGFLAYYVRQPEYVRVSTWNYNHVVLAKPDLNDIGHDPFPLEGVFSRLFSSERWWRGYLTLLPVAGPFALLEILRVAWRAAKRRFDAWELLMVGWGASTFGALLLTPYIEVIRFNLILFPPVALLAARFLSVVATVGPVPRRARWVAVALPLLAFVVVHGRWYERFVAHPRYELIAANARIEDDIGAKAPAVVIGLWAAPLIFETPFKHYYVKSEFNSTHDAIVQLAPTHLVLLEGRDFTKSILARRFHGLLQQITPQDSFRVRRARVDLYALKEPLR